MENPDDDKVKSVNKRKSQIFRKRKTSSNSDSDQDESDIFRSVLEDTKELQNLRKKPNGVSVLGLAAGKRFTVAEEMVNNDLYKLKTGGMIDMKNMKVVVKTAVDELDAVNLGNTFSVETNRRDEDADMMKYIDEELAKRKGVANQNTELHNNQSKAEDVLFQVPEHLRLASSSQSEEMLSNQMLSGIPEVDLGIEERIRNIESTEEAKQRLLKDRLRKKESGTSFVPTNMAVNFVQHNRFNIEDGEQNKGSRPVVPPVIKAKRQQPVVNISECDVPPVLPGQKRHGLKKPDDDKATDDFHFEKFKKQFRRY